jgi:ABC-type multidrug transport system ATPase subunit
MKFIKNNTIKHFNNIIIIKDGKQIINPSKEQILADGWIEYIPPTYEPTPIDVEEQRRQAYQIECDQYLIAYQGYLLESNVEKAEVQKALYLAKKEEIRKRFEQDATR